MKTQHYLTYAADQRVSMDLYAERLKDGLTQNGQKIHQFRPKSILESYSKSKMLMRWLRYVTYPWMVKNKTADIHHILDHGYAHLLPKLGSGRTCITVHDLIPMLSWQGGVEGLPKTRKPQLNLYSLEYVSLFDRVIVPSKSTKKDLLENFNVDERKISIIPSPIGDDFLPQEVKEVAWFKKKYGFKNNEFTILLTGREFYKNHVTGLYVLKELITQYKLPVRIIKSGLSSAEFNLQVEKLGLCDYVQCLYVENFQELPLLYNSVDCLLFPSLYEGFGLPVAEALACGTPVVSSNAASLPELSGGFVLQYDPLDVPRLVEGVLTVIEDSQWRLKVAEGAPAWAARYHARHVATHVKQLYSEMSRMS